MIKLKNTPEQRNMAKAMGSRDPAVSRPAHEAFAAAIGDVIQVVLEQAGTASLIYVDKPFNEDDSPSYPLDLYYNESDGYVTVWSQQIAGALPSSEVAGVAELKISTYRLDSAVNFLKQYARKQDLNVLSKATEKMIQEVLVKQERLAWAVLLRALGEANTNVNGVSTKHTITSTTQKVLQLDDFSRLITLNKRLNSSFAGGTTANPFSKGITDMFMSPEMKEQIRGMAFQPQNTRGVPNSDESTALGLPDQVRQTLFENAGADSFYGVNITELNELGKTYKYNVLFGNYAQAGIAAGGATFNTSTDELVLGIDLGKEAAVRAVELVGDTGSTFSVSPDDQFRQRDERVGFYGSLREGRIFFDKRAVVGVII